MSDGTKKETIDPLLRIAASGQVDHDVARVIIGSHSPEVSRATEEFLDDMGSAPCPGGWKRRRSS